MASEAIIKAIDDATVEIERVLDKCNASALAQLPALKRAVSLAGGVMAMRKALSDEIIDRVFLPLQGSPLGFVTDKDKDGGYPIFIVRDCMIEGMIKGAQPINNEINIISGRCYIAKNGLKRMVTQWPGMSALTLTPGVPQMVGDRGALIAMRATWLLHGVHGEVYRGLNKETGEDTRFAVRVNAGMGPDAIIGKAERKMYSAIYSMLTGGAITVEEGEAIDTVGVAVNPPPPPPVEEQGKRIKLGKQPEPVVDRGDNPDAH